VEGVFTPENQCECSRTQSGRLLITLNINFGTLLGRRIGCPSARTFELPRERGRVYAIGNISVSPHIVLAHELIHALHFLENPLAYEANHALQAVPGGHPW